MQLKHIYLRNLAEIFYEFMQDDIGVGTSTGKIKSRIST